MESRARRSEVVLAGAAKQIASIGARIMRQSLSPRGLVGGKLDVAPCVEEVMRLKRVVAFALAGALRRRSRSRGGHALVRAESGGARRGRGPSRIVIPSTSTCCAPTASDLRIRAADLRARWHFATACRRAGVTSAGWTLPAHASLFSSQSVAAHGVHRVSDGPLRAPLAEVLSQSGVVCPASRKGVRDAG